MVDIVVVFSGKPGSGKTVSAVRYIYRDPRKRVFANISLSIPGKEVVPIGRDTIRDLKSLRDGIVFIDEANFVFSSRFWRNVPRDIINFWAMHRKYGVDLVLTSHSLKRIDIVLRELVAYEYRCQFHFGVVFNTVYDVDYAEKLYTYFFFPRKYFRMYDTFEIVNVSI